MKVYEIVYSVNENQKKLKIFTPNYVKEYKNYSKFIYKGKLFPITEELSLTDKNTTKLKIKLITFKSIPNNTFLYCAPINKFNKQRIYKKTNDDIKHYINIKKLIYKINPNQNKIRIFGRDFVVNNKNKCQIIYGNRIFPLKEYFSIEGVEKNKEKINKLIIYLKELENISDLSCMFKDCTSLEEYSSFKQNNNNSTDIKIDNNINKERQKSFIDEFYTMNKYIYIPYSFSTLNSEFNLEESQDCKDNIYHSSFDYYSLSNIDTNSSDIKDIINNINILSTSNISIEEDYKYLTNIKSIFNGCSSLISLPDISQWNIEKIQDLSFIFNGCSSLISLPDISRWITKSVVCIDNIFNDCSSLISLPDISQWITDRMTSMNSIFRG